MAAIVQTFAADKALTLANEEFVRGMSWGTNWRRIRIAINHSGQFVGNFSNEYYYIGVCQGTTNTFKSGTTTEWVGAWVGSAGGTWNYTAGPPGGVTQGGSNAKWGYKTGATPTSTGNASNNNYVPKTNRDYWFVDIEQTATGYIIGVRAPSSIPTVDTFGRRFEMYTNGNDLTTSGIINFSSNRLLDTVSIYWTYAAVPLEISEIMVVRYA